MTKEEIMECTDLAILQNRMNEIQNYMGSPEDAMTALLAKANSGIDVTNDPEILAMKDKLKDFVKEMKWIQERVGQIKEAVLYALELQNMLKGDKDK